MSLPNRDIGNFIYSADFDKVSKGWSSFIVVELYSHSVYKLRTSSSSRRNSSHTTRNPEIDDVISCPVMLAGSLEIAVKLKLTFPLS